MKKDLLLKAVLVIFTVSLCAIMFCACGDNDSSRYLEFTLSKNGESYNAEPKDRSNLPESIQIPSTYKGKPVTSVSGFRESTSLKSVVIPEGVTFIQDFAFSQCLSLSSVTLPDSLKTIGKGAFELTGLTNITVPDSVTSIGDYAFRNCSLLTSAILPGTLTEISNTAFYNVYLQEITAPVSVLTKISLKKLQTVVINGGSEIPADLFSGYQGESLTHLEIGDTITSIGGGAFYDVGLESVSLGNNVTEIGGSAFMYCPLKSVVLPDSLTTLESNAFRGCAFLSDINIPDGLQKIKSGTFMDCSSLKSITIPESVKCIERDAFRGCVSLTSVVIPNSMVNIFEKAFCSCTGLLSVTIGSGISTIDDMAFYGCTSLVEIYNLSSLSLIAGSSTHPSYLGYYAKAIHTSLGEESILHTTKDGFVFCETDDGVWLMDYIGTETKLALPETYNGKHYSVYSYAFSRRHDITSVTIPDGIDNIMANAFLNCTQLTEVHIKDVAAWCKITFDGSYANPLCYAGHLYLNGEEIKDLVIPDGVTSIGDYAFLNCESLLSVTVPNSLTSIGKSAFKDCNGLTKVNTSDMTAWCGIDFGNAEANPLYCAKHLYLDDKEITYYMFPNTVTAIKDYAFVGCEGLISLNFPETVTSIGNHAFSYCKGIISMTIGSEVTSLGDYAFGYCENMRVINFTGNKVKTIGKFAFVNCMRLSGVIITDLEAWRNISFADDEMSNPLYYAKDLVLNGENVNP